MMVGIMQKTRIEAGRRRRRMVAEWKAKPVWLVAAACFDRLLRRNRREEALNVNNTKSINEKKKTEPDWQLFDQLLHYSNHNSPYGALLGSAVVKRQSGSGSCDWRCGGNEEEGGHLQRFFGYFDHRILLL